MGRMVAEWMVDGQPELDPRARHRTPLSPCAPRVTSGRSVSKGSTRSTASFIRASNGLQPETSASVPSTLASKGWERSSSRRRAGSGLTGTRRMSRCLKNTETGSDRRPNGMRAGGHRSSMPSTWPCAIGSPMFDLRLRHLRRPRPRRARARPDPHDAADATSRRARDLHAGLDAARRLPHRPHHRAARRPARSGWSPAASTAMADLKWFADHQPAGRQRAGPTTAPRRWCHARPLGPARAGHPRGP